MKHFEKSVRKRLFPSDCSLQFFPFFGMKALMLKKYKSVFFCLFNANKDIVGFESWCSFQYILVAHIKQKLSLWFIGSVDIALTLVNFPFAQGLSVKDGL